MPDPIPAPSLTPVSTVFLGMPHCGPVQLGAARGLYRCDGNVNIMSIGSELSILAHNFNELWAMALNERVNQSFDYFAMLHSDIKPMSNRWLQTLIDEIRRTGADVMSAVVPIKTEHGESSTAIDCEGGSGYEIERKLTMHEVYQLPETFSAADCGFSDRNLLINTGCWVCDFRKPWVEEAFFATFTDIQKNDAGKFCTKVVSEDWLFSRFVQARGGKVMATRKVPLVHMGNFEYSNQYPWGLSQTHQDKPALVLPERKDVA